MGRTAMDRSERGSSLLELLVATGIMLVVTGALFTLLSPSQGMFRSQPEAADMQQRMRMGVNWLYRDLLIAGAGPSSGPATGSLNEYFAPVVPYRIGARDPDAPRTFRRDAISLVYVPPTAAQTTIQVPLVQPISPLTVDQQPGCPAGDPVCGFKVGMTVLIFDDTGANDTFTITGVQAPVLHVEKRGASLSKAYAPGASIVEAATVTYYLDRASHELRRYDGMVTDLPIVDDVVDLAFRYFGDPQPPRSPRPPSGWENCLFDAAGSPRLPVLPSAAGSLVELNGDLLTAGPLCGAGAGVFDADLYRVRTVRVTLRVQVTSPELRGADSVLFRQPGVSRSTTRIVPDYELSFDVSPRNLNLSR